MAARSNYNLLYADLGESDMVEVAAECGLFIYRQILPDSGRVIYEWPTSSPGALREKMAAEMGEVPAGLSAALRMAAVFEGWGRL